MIDGENVSVSYANEMLRKASCHGPLTIKRVFGNTGRINGWCEQPGFRIMHSGSGKNAADILLAIEAVDLAHSDLVDTFILVSSDGDFQHLAHRLRESGFRVIGLGLDKAPETFRKACSEFHELRGVQSTKPALDELDAQIHAVIRNASGRQSLPITSLNALMRNKHNIKISDRPEKTWRRYLESKPGLYHCGNKGQDAQVKLLR